MSDPYTTLLALMKAQFKDIEAILEQRVGKDNFNYGNHAYVYKKDQTVARNIAKLFELFGEEVPDSFDSKIIKVRELYVAILQKLTRPLSVPKLNQEVAGLVDLIHLLDLIVNIN